MLTFEADMKNQTFIRFERLSHQHYSISFLPCPQVISCILLDIQSGSYYAVGLLQVKHTHPHTFVFLSLFHVLIFIIYIARLLKWASAVLELG